MKHVFNIPVFGDDYTRFTSRDERHVCFIEAAVGSNFLFWAPCKILLLAYLLISSVEEIPLTTFAIASYNLRMTLTNMIFETISLVNDYSFY